MNGPEHYRRAEELIKGGAEVIALMQQELKMPGAKDLKFTITQALKMDASLLAQAQVHATLALVAASAPTRALAPDDLPGRVIDAWIAVLS